LTRNPEFTRLQYALRDRALALGREASRIVVIDDDLGRSGCSTAGRPGFQRLAAEVGLDQVRVILCVEMYRFARQGEIVQPVKSMEQLPYPK
jgi:DNA invertase Pin-like site-specific DNA recombinase